MVKQRNYTLDLVKLICAFGVISIHVPSGTPAADYIGNFFHPFCVPFFFVVSLTYFIKGLSKAPFDKQLSKIWYRLVVPLLSWTTIYLILLILKKVLTKERLNPDITNAYFYGQIAVQLYYLPALILMQLYTLSGYLLMNNLKSKNLIGLALVAICIVYHVLGYQRKCFGIETFIWYPTFVLAGFIMYTLLEKQVFLKRISFALGLLLCTIVLLINFNIISINSALAPFFNSKISYLVSLVVFPIGGLGLFLITIDLPSIKTTKITSKIMSASYGIYLSHVIFLEALQFFIEHILHQKLLYTFTVKLLITLSIFIASLLFTLLTNQIPFLNFLLYGEKNNLKKAPVLT